MSLAECAVLAKQLNETVKGKKIVDVIANQNPHTFVWFALSPEFAYSSPENCAKFAKEYYDLMIGKTIDNADVRFGGYGLYNFLHIGNRALMFHALKTNLHSKGEKRAKRHQLLLELEDGTALSFCGSLGGPLFFFEKDQNGDALGYKSDYPFVTDEAFSREFFMDLINKTELRSLSVKAFLATDNRIQGIDNSILQEILFEAQVNPKTKMALLPDADRNRIFDAIKKVFPAVIENGGKDTDKDLFGNYGRYETKVSKNTLGMPCVRCGEPIVKEAFLGGAVYYCPKCQPISKGD